MYVYLFEDGGLGLEDLLGSKGALLSEAIRVGVPVPPGLVVTAEAHNDYCYMKRLPEELEKEIFCKIEEMEARTGHMFNDPQNPLLFSIRPSPPASVPQVINSILNVGLNDEAVQGLIRSTGCDLFAYDAYRRLIQTFGQSAFHIGGEQFQRVVDTYRGKLKAKGYTEFDILTLESIIRDFKELCRKETGKDFPQDPLEQLRMSVSAVLDSWNTPEALLYRKTNHISDKPSIAVIIQTMVFGNKNNRSGTGVCSTRHPATGEPKPYGHFLINSQGKDVFAGIRTPEPISVLKEKMPDAYKQLLNAICALECCLQDMQKIDFVVEDGKLFILQTRPGKRSVTAALRVAVNLAQEGIIGEEQALLQIKPSWLEKLIHRRVDFGCTASPIATGLPASPGVATGRVVFRVDEACELGEQGEAAILVRREATPGDIRGIIAVQGLLTSRGGVTSHAIVVARGMGKPAVVGCEQIKIDLSREHFIAGHTIIRKGDIVTIDGTRGTVLSGHVSTIEPKLHSWARLLLKWADGVRKLRVRANVDSPEEARKAREFGSDGVGLCRTERMFLTSDSLRLVQELVSSSNVENRAQILEKMQHLHKKNFKRILGEMQQLPVAIRLLDLPLHKVLLGYDQLQLETTSSMRARNNDSQNALNSKKRILAQIERNPMLGHRGCRLAISYPEIYEMQTRAIIEAAGELRKEGLDASVEIMVPFVGLASEIGFLRDRIEFAAAKMMKSMGTEMNYTIGVMIEIPRAALTADEIAEHVDFFSFGTNDLTQTTFAYSRDDAEATFLKDYLENEILTSNPFVVLDRKGVGKLMRLAVENGKASNHKLEFGLCGEHGGDPDSIQFCHELGLHYISCSPQRVPVARLAAAQAALRPRDP